jgi:hypothetical protein
MTFRIVCETEVGAAGIFGKVVDAAVGIDFQHERHAVAVDTKIAAPKARTLESDEEACANIAQASIEPRVVDRKGRHLLVTHPLHIRMLEGLAFGKAVLNRRVGLGPRRIVRILRHKNRTLRPSMNSSISAAPWRRMIMPGVLWSAAPSQMKKRARSPAGYVE